MRGRRYFEMELEEILLVWEKMNDVVNLMW
jgi:hypothetical protein